MIFNSQIADHPILDCHCHAGRGDRMTAPWNTIAPLKSYLRRARGAGIDKTIVIPAFHSNYAQANEELGRIVARAPERLIGFAFVHARRDAGRIREMIGRAVEKWNFRGIKAHGFDAMPTREVCETARAFRLPVLVDVVSRPEVIDMFAPEYPDVNFIIPHLGSFTDDWKAHQQVIYQIALSQRLCRHLRRPAVRLSGSSHPACGRTQAAVWLRRPLDTPWLGTSQNKIVRFTA
jgi:predicted TIM-barrel fold metal-dependent hydrolase